MNRTFALFAALSLAGPAAAATYSARPATPVAEQRIIARSIVWTCGPEACRGSTEESRPVALCQSLARKAGRIASFAVDGRALAAAELDKCNASAPVAPSSALARAR